MARIPNMKYFNDENRLSTIQPSVLRIENKDGDVLLFTPEEAKDALREYISQELALHARKTVDNHRQQLNDMVKTELIELKTDMDKIVNREINNMVEKIIHSVMEYNIEAEVDRRVKDKLEKILKEL